MTTQTYELRDLLLAIGTIKNKGGNFIDMPSWLTDDDIQYLKMIGIKVLYDTNKPHLKTLTWNVPNAAKVTSEHGRYKAVVDGKEIKYNYGIENKVRAKVSFIGALKLLFFPWIEVTTKTYALNNPRIVQREINFEILRKNKIKK